MKFLLVDQEGLGLSLALRAREAGHQVRWFVKPDKSVSSDIGKGFKGIEKITNWVPHVKWADLILPTFNADYMEKLEFFKKQGFPVFGPSPESAKLEISRKDGMKLLESIGLEIAPYKIFKDMAAAELHVKQTKERFVFKTLGDNEDKALTYVSKDYQDMLAWIRRTPSPKGEVMLQSFVEGIEMGVSRFMGTKGWVGQWNESFEHKKLMPSNYGPNTGEMGTVAYFTEQSRLGTDTLGKLEKKLLAMNHRGDIAIGFMIPEDGKPRPTEFTSRLGWPIMNMMLGATKGDPISWMKDACDGKDTTTFNEDIGICLVLAHADFPRDIDPKEVTHGVPVFGVTNGNKKHLHPQFIQSMKLKDMDKDIWCTAGNYVCVITGFGDTVSQASERAYKTAKQLYIANQILRDDIGEELEETLPKLHKMGFAIHCSYS